MDISKEWTVTVTQEEFIDKTLHTTRLTSYLEKLKVELKEIDQDIEFQILEDDMNKLQKQIVSKKTPRKRMMRYGPRKGKRNIWKEIWAKRKEREINSWDQCSSGWHIWKNRLQYELRISLNEKCYKY